MSFAPIKYEFDNLLSKRRERERESQNIKEEEASCNVSLPFDTDLLDDQYSKLF